MEVTATTAAVEEIKAAPNALQAEAVAKRFAWPEELRQAAVEALGVHGIGEAEATEILGLPPVAEPPPAKTIEPEGWLALQCSAFATFHDLTGKKNTVAAAMRSHQKPPKARRDLLHRIGELKAAEVALGEGTDERKAAKDKVRDAKLGLPSFIYQGVFDGEGKGDEHWREATGIVALDYDGFTSAEDAKAFKRLLFDKCGFVGAAWLSGSGMGVHALALGPVTETAEEYTAVWRGVDAAATQRVGRSADPSRKNRNGILFGSHDPDLLWRTDPEEFAPTKAEPQTKRSVKPSANGEGERTAALRGLEDMLAHIDCPTLDYFDWLAVLMGAHSEFGDQALKAIHVWCQTDPVRYEEKDVNSRWRGFKAEGGTGIGTIVKMAMERGWRPQARRESMTSAEVYERLAAMESSDDEDSLTKAVRDAVKAIADQPDFQDIARMALNYGGVSSDDRHMRSIARAVRRRINNDREVASLEQTLERSSEAAEEAKLADQFERTWTLYRTSEDDAEKADALQTLRTLANTETEGLQAILEAEETAIREAHDEPRERLSKLADKLGGKDDAKLDAEYDKLLAARQEAEDEARKVAVDAILGMRAEVLAERAEALAVLTDGEDGTPESKAVKAVERIGQSRVKQIDDALKKALFMVPKPVDQVAKAGSASKLVDLWAEDPAATHTGSSWGRFKNETKHVEWLVPYMIPRGMVTILAGEAGLGKSRLTIQLALAESLRADVWGKPFIPAKKGNPTELADIKVNRRRRPSLTVIANAEDTQEIVAKRICEIAKTLGVSRSDPEDPLQVEFVQEGMDEGGLGILSAALSRIDFFNPQGAIWAPEQDGSTHIETEAGLTPMGAALRERCEQIGATLLILDPLANLYASSENTRAHVAAFMRSWNAWAQRTGITVVMVAHPPKSGADFSGSTTWVGAARSAVKLTNEWVGKVETEGSKVPEYFFGKDAKDLKTGEGQDKSTKKKKTMTKKKLCPCISIAKSNHAKFHDRRWWLDISEMGIQCMSLDEVFEPDGGGNEANGAPQSSAIPKGGMSGVGGIVDAGDPYEED